MEKRIIHTEKAPAAVGPYVQAVKKGNMLFASGQIGLDPETGVLREGIEAQTRQVLANIQAVLDAAEMKKSDIVRTLVFLDDIKDFTTVNEIYAEFFGEDKPARSCVEAANLPKGALVEIEITAVE